MASVVSGSLGVADSAMSELVPDRSGRLVLAWLTLYMVVLFAIPAPLVVGPLGSAGAPSMIMGLVSAPVWFLVKLRRTPTEDDSLGPIRVSLGLFLACVGISYAIAMSRPIESDEISQADVALLVVGAWSGVLLMTHDGLADVRAVSTLARRFAIMGGLMACLGLAQMVTGRLLVDVISVPGLRPIGGIDASFRYGLIRMSGTATSPIEFGALLTILFPLAVHNAIHPISRNFFLRWFPVAAISLALALSLSRSAYIGFVVALVVLLIGWPRQLRQRAITLVIIASMFMAAAAPQVLRAVRSMFVTAADDPSITSRTDSYAVVWQFFLEAPWFGRGLGTFLPKYRILDNNYLGLLVNVGSLGLLAFTAILVVAMVLLWRYRRLEKNEKNRDLALSLFAGIGAGAVSLAFFDAFGFPMTTGTLFLTLGLAGSLVRLRQRVFAESLPSVAGIHKLESSSNS